MADTIILVTHGENFKDDRVSSLLAARGYQLEWHNIRTTKRLPEPAAHHAAAVVYGGTESANDTDTHAYMQHELDWVHEWIASGKHYLGLCLGAQMLGRALGVEVIAHARGLAEIGYVEVHPTDTSDHIVFDSAMHAYQWHREGLETLPAGCALLATNDTFPVQAFSRDENVYGLQFHPEVSPQIRTRWLDEAAHMLSTPGAHDRDRQLADTQRYDGAQQQWLRRFIDHWLSK